MDKQREQSRSSPKKTGGSTAHAQRHHGDEATGRRWAGTRGREAAGKRLGLTSGPLPRRRPEADFLFQGPSTPHRVVQAQLGGGSAWWQLSRYMFTEI